MITSPGEAHNGKQRMAPVASPCFVGPGRAFNVFRQRADSDDVDRRGAAGI
jgi:hypothetical protein